MKESGETAKAGNGAVQEIPRDARVEVTFSENALEARGEFFPGTGGGLSFTDEYIQFLLKSQDITYGIRLDSIQEAVTICNQEQKEVKDVLLARGIPPKNEVAEYIQVNPSLGKNQVEEKGGRVDFRAYSPFIIVKKGQALAKRKPRKPGKDGTDVHGNPIPQGITRPEGVTAGENTVMEGEFLVSTVNGEMVNEKDVISVRESLHIKGAVGYRTGNIAFPGDVIIDGPVSDGFKIYSGGSITIKQTFDVTDASSKGNLTVTGGIIGRGRAMVKVGGVLKTKFIENCRIACRKSVIVGTEIINSQIYSLENVDLGDKGFIIGGEIYSVRGVRAAGIGKKSVGSARIHCGIDFTLNQEKEKNNNILRLTAAKLKYLKQLLEEPDLPDDKKAKLEKLGAQLEEEQRQASEKVSDLMGRVNADQNAVIEVLGEIVPGTLLEICQVALFVTDPLKKVRISLDRNGGKLITTPL